MDSSHRPTAELINIIKELFYNSSGENTEERDKIIKKVDIQYNECDARIDKYIRNSSKDLSRLIKVFNDIAKKLKSLAQMCHIAEKRSNSAKSFYNQSETTYDVYGSNGANKNTTTTISQSLSNCTWQARTFALYALTRIT